MVANVYLLHVLVCYMMMQVKYYLVTMLRCGLNNCGSKQRSTYPIVLAKTCQPKESKRIFQNVKHEVICLTGLVVGVS